MRAPGLTGNTLDALATEHEVFLRLRDEVRRGDARAIVTDVGKEFLRFRVELELFEESNALNVPFLKERLYGEYDRSAFLNECRNFIGLGNADQQNYEVRIDAPSLSSVKIDSLAGPRGAKGL